MKLCILTLVFYSHQKSITFHGREIFLRLILFYGAKSAFNWEIEIAHNPVKILLGSLQTICSVMIFRQ